MSDPQLTRRAALGSAGSLALTGRLFDGDGADAVTDLAVTDPGAAQRYDGLPSFVVGLDGSDAGWEALREWAKEDDRDVRAEATTLDLAAVSAPRAAVGAPIESWWSSAGGGLAAEDYVDLVDLDVAMGLAEPVRRAPLHGADGTNFRATLESQFDELWVDTLGGHTPPATTSDATGLAVGDDTEVRPIADAFETMDAHDVASAAGGSVDTSGPLIGVADTGVNTDGNAIGSGRIAETSADYTTSGNPTVGDNSVGVVEDGNGHGTWVAASQCGDPTSVPSDAASSTVSDYRGALPNADLWIGKALNDDGSGSMASIATAVDGAVAADVDVLCMSLGSPLYSAALERAIATAVGEDIVVVVAAGNDRFGTTWIATPASANDAMGIHATTAAPSDSESVLPAWFANTGPHPGTTDTSGGDTSGATPAFAAPGMDLEVAAPQPDGSTSASVMSGTSMAAPCAAAVAALVAQGTDEDGARAVWDRMERTAHRPPALADVEGAGLPSAQRAIDDEGTDQSQADAMNSQAQSRAGWYRSASSVSGRTIPRF